MIQLLEIYKWTLLAGMIQAGFLSLLGVHLSARDKSIQSLCLSQAAAFGVLLGLGLSDVISGGHFHENDVTSLVFGFIAVAVIYFFSEKISLNKKSSSSTVFVSLFLVLMAGSHWLVSFFPTLESHMSQTFFGDLATLSNMNLNISLIISLNGLILLMRYFRPFARDSFNFAVLDSFFVVGRPSWRGFQLLVLIGITTSIFSSGLLFTVTSLFLPTVIFSFWSRSGLRVHSFLCASLAILSTGIGFLVSLVWSRFPTVPTIVIVESLLGLLVLAVGSSRLFNGNHIRS